MGRIIVRVGEIDRRRDRRIRIGLRIREEIGLREEIKGETGRRGMQAEGVLVEALEVRREEMPGIGRVGVRRELLEGIGLGVMLVRVVIVRVGLLRVLGVDGLGGILAMQCREGLDRRGMRGRGVRQRMRVGHQPITRGLRGILMRDSRREAIGHRDRHNRDHSHSRGRSLSHSNGLSQGRSRRVRDRVDLAGIIMPERRGRRAIAVEPARVLAVVADNEEVDRDEIT
jgi:hypothetical protein